jgi:predicted secreted Zn-dependent protease
VQYDVAEALKEMVQEIEQVEQGLKQTPEPEAQRMIEKELAEMKREVTKMYRRYILNKEEEDGK